MQIELRGDRPRRGARGRDPVGQRLGALGRARPAAPRSTLDGRPRPRPRRSSTSTTGRRSGATRPRRARSSAPRSSSRARRSATARSAASPSAATTRARPRTRCSTRLPARDRQAGRRGRARRHAERARGRARIARCEVVCGLGAGDAFGGALCHGAACRLAAGRVRALRQRRRARSSPRACCAPTRCPTSREVRALHGGAGAEREAAPARRQRSPHGDDPLLVTPESAGVAALRPARRAPAAGRLARPSRRGGDEIAVLPLSGGACTVEVEGRRFELQGARASSRA